MATKKSSRAAKKKSAPKKAAKKPASASKAQNSKKEQTLFFANDESAQASLQSPVPASESSETSEKEANNGVYMFLVLAGVLAIAYLGYSKWQNSKKEPVAVETKQVVTAPKAEEKPAVEETKSEETATASAGFLIEKISTKKWNDAASYCKSIGGNLPTKQELVDFSKSAPAKLKENTDKYWTSMEDGKKSAFATRLSNGKTSSLTKVTETKVLCKN